MKKTIDIFLTDFGHGDSRLRDTKQVRTMYNNAQVFAQTQVHFVALSWALNGDTGYYAA